MGKRQSRHQREGLEAGERTGDDITKTFDLDEWTIVAMSDEEHAPSLEHTATKGIESGYSSTESTASDFTYEGDHFSQDDTCVSNPACDELLGDHCNVQDNNYIGAVVFSLGEADEDKASVVLPDSDPPFNPILFQDGGVHSAEEDYHLQDDVCSTDLYQKNKREYNVKVAPVNDCIATAKKESNLNNDINTCAKYEVHTLTETIESVSVCSSDMIKTKTSLGVCTRLCKDDNVRENLDENAKENHSNKGEKHDHLLPNYQITRKDVSSFHKPAITDVCFPVESYLVDNKQELIIEDQDTMNRKTDDSTEADCVSTVESTFDVKCRDSVWSQVGQLNDESLARKDILDNLKIKTSSNKYTDNLEENKPSNHAARTGGCYIGKCFRGHISINNKTNPEIIKDLQNIESTRHLIETIDAKNTSSPLATDEVQIEKPAPASTLSEDNEENILKKGVLNDEKHLAVTCCQPKSPQYQQFVCETCGQFFSFDDHFQAHVSVHPVAFMYPSLRCGGCGAKFSFVEALNTHKAISRSEEGTRCHRCLQWFPTCDDLYRHRQRWQNEHQAPATVLAPHGFFVSNIAKTLRRF